MIAVQYVRRWLCLLACSVGLCAGNLWARGNTPQSLTWLGETNAVLSLNIAHPLSVTASSGLPVNLRVDQGPTTISDGKIIIADQGTVVVTATQAGDATFLPVQESRSFNLRTAVLIPRGKLEGLNGGLGVQVKGLYAYLGLCMNFCGWEGAFCG